MDIKPATIRGIQCFPSLLCLFLKQHCNPSSGNGEVKTQGGSGGTRLILQPSPPQMMPNSQAPTKTQTNPPQASTHLGDFNIKTSPLHFTPPFSQGSAPEFPPLPPKPTKPNKGACLLPLPPPRPSGHQAMPPSSATQAGPQGQWLISAPPLVRSWQPSLPQIHAHADAARH